jgi:hypothetical protein
MTIPERIRVRWGRMRWIPSPDTVQKRVITTRVVIAEERSAERRRELVKASPAHHETGDERPKKNQAIGKRMRVRMRVGIRRMAIDREKKSQ